MRVQPHLGHRLLLVTGFAIGAAARAEAQDHAPSATEPVFHYSALDNGDFREINSTVTLADGTRPIPWWNSSRGAAMTKDGVLTLGEHDWVEQRIPAYVPLLASLTIRATVEHGFQYSLADASGTFSGGGGGSSSPGAKVPFAFSMDSHLNSNANSGKPVRVPVPSFVLRLQGAADGTNWSKVEALVDLPCPSEAALRAEIIAHVNEILVTWFERGGDDIGPKKTRFLAKLFDAVTGAQLGVGTTTGFTSLYQLLFEALEVEEVPAWRELFDGFLEDFLALQLHPTTGLPRGWNPTTDVGDDTTPVELAMHLGFLIDVAERGPEKFRARTKAAAIKIGECVLANGLVPDGNCAASYVPATGKPNLDVNPLRRLDVPLQLVRLSKLTHDPRFAAAAREPLATFEFTNRWAGTWAQIDSGFDDDFGIYGGRASRAAWESPDEIVFRRFALEGWKHYEPIWRDALRFGGNIAADQVRCWKIGSDLAHIEPSMRATMGPLLRIAARSHFKGEQYGNGVWGDLTIFDYKPVSLQVGDFTGAPQNLLVGLATIYTSELGLRTDEIRAMYTTVLRSSVAQYKRPYGFLMERVEHKGANSAYGSHRMLAGLVEMLRALSQPK